VGGSRLGTAAAGARGTVNFVLRLIFSRRWLPRHLFVVLMVAVFLVLGWWQLKRGEQGNLRSFAYALEWPLFAAFLIFGWWKMLHLEAYPPEEKRIGPEPGDRAAVSPTGPAAGEHTAQSEAAQRTPQEVETDAELAAYNRYLAWLNEQDRQKAR
jgi:DNA-binding transcriptional regulator of glucitol operon